MSNLERFNAPNKVRAHPEWVVAYLEKGYNYPITLEIDPTNSCPLNCADRCPWHDWRRDSKDSLDSMALIRVINEAKDLGVQSLIWTGGGEPLSNPATLKSIQYAKSLGLENGMFTTGVAMTPRATEILLDSLSWVRFHLDGPNSISYAEVHGTNEQVFNKVRKNIRYFNARKAERGVCTSVGIGTIAMISKIGEIEKFVQLALSLGVDYFQLKHDLSQMTNQNYLEWWNNVVVPILDQLSQNYETVSFKLQYSKGVEYLVPNNSIRCHAHHLSTAITANGDVVYCKSTRDVPEWKLGNIKDASLKDIFDGDLNKRLSEQITPQNCGVLPCPLKTSNELLHRVYTAGDINNLGSPPENAEFPNFI